MMTQTKFVLIHATIMLVAAVCVSCNLSNLEGIYELKLVSKWLQYLSKQQIKDQDGKLLLNKYFIDNNGVSHSSEFLRDEDDSFEDLKKLIGWQWAGDGIINALALRPGPNNTDKTSTKAWARIAKDMLWTIDTATLEGDGSEFLSTFKRDVFNPWQDVIYARYNSILRLDRQDALHLAILKAHQDFYVLVCQRMREKLPPDMEKFLPKLAHWKDPHERVQLDHIKWELKALKKYREFRKLFENDLNSGQLSSVIEVLPVSIQDAAYGFEVDPHLVHFLGEIGDEREISVKYLVKLNESGLIIDENGSKLDVETNRMESSRFVWRAIHRGLRILGQHMIQTIDPNNIRRIDQSNLETLRMILSSLKEAVVQRVNELNGMMDNKINQDLITNFLSQRNSLNELFDQISDDLPLEKRSIWFELLNSLNLVKEGHDGAINRFHLVIERESLLIDAKQLFSQAMEHLTEIDQRLKPVAESLRGAAFEAIDCYEGDEIRNRLTQKFEELKGECAKVEAEAEANHGGIEKVVETFQKTATEHVELSEEELKKSRNKLRDARRQAGDSLKDFFTYISAYTIRSGDQRLPNLVADIVENSRGLL